MMSMHRSKSFFLLQCPQNNNSTTLRREWKLRSIAQSFAWCTVPAIGYQASGALRLRAAKLVLTIRQWGSVEWMGGRTCSLTNSGTIVIGRANILFTIRTRLAMILNGIISRIRIPRISSTIVTHTLTLSIHNGACCTNFACRTYFRSSRRAKPIGRWTLLTSRDSRRCLEIVFWVGRTTRSCRVIAGLTSVTSNKHVAIRSKNRAIIGSNERISPLSTSPICF
mmetsp:Transcript_19948/g.32766  ORF Transcript_19948/g.32766 Transcript_19948/m.32766 type:complete len:224 (-) Transcript_19948:727-1398(-)